MIAKTAPERAPRVAGKAEKTARRYAAALIAVAVLALAARSMLLAILGVLAVVAVAVLRARKAWRWHRAGGKTAKRHRAQYQGHATPAEIRRNLSHDRGVLIGTVRSFK